MWAQRGIEPGGYQEFFRLIFCDDTLANYYRTNFDLKHNHGFSLNELDYMLPFEREVYIAILIKHLQDEKNKLETKRSGRK